MEHIGNQLKKAIKERGMTQDQASERLGITRQTLGLWLKRQNFDANTLHKIYDNLGIDLKGLESPKKSDNITLTREVFEKISQLIDTVCSQQGTISSQQETIGAQHGTIDRLLSNGKPVASKA